MTSGLRGLNLDDWRPDFIVCDDINNEENTGTEDQRTKTKELFFGALSPSLAPKSEAPLRKFVLLQTGLNKDDLIHLVHKDPSFQTVRYPQLVMVDGVERSAWEQRFPTEECLKEREDYIRRNQYHVWLREYGCKIISRETAPLAPAWLREWTALPTNLRYYIGLDPASSKKKKAHKTAIGIVGVQPNTGNTYLVEYFAQRGVNPDEMWVWLYEKIRTYHPRKVGAETIAFQEMLAWYLEKKMQETKFFFVLDRVQDKRSKPDRIIQSFSGLASQGKFFISPSHIEFKQGWEEWTEDQDWDLGDAIAQAIALANPWMVQTSIDGEVEALEEEEEYPDLVYAGGAP
jgi:hypothetical protein